MGSKGLIAMFSVSGILILFSAYVSFLPEIVSSEVSVEVSDSKDNIINYLSVSSNWQNWVLRPLSEDPKRRTLLSGPTQGEGSVLKWFSELDGDGGLEIKALDSNQIVFEMITDNNAFRSRGYLQFESVSTGTKITWLDSLDIATNLQARYAAQDSSFIEKTEAFNLEALNRLKQAVTQ